MDSEPYTETKTGNEQRRNQKQKTINNIPDGGNVLQSIWIRCRSIFPNTLDRKFMESELRFVLYCGAFLWFIYLLSKII